MWSEMAAAKGKGSRDESYRLGKAESALVGHAVAMTLVQRKISQKWLADALLLAPSVVSDLINARRTWDRTMLANVASVLGVKEADLLPPPLRGLANFAAWGRAAKQITEIAEMLIVADETARDRAVAVVRKALTDKPPK